jgi:hypothetical protein
VSDLAKPFILCTDASKVAIGAVLSQLDDRGHEKPCWYASKTLVQETVNDDKVAIVGSSSGSSSKHAVEEMIAAQMNDPWIKRIINYLSTKELPEDDKEARRLIVDAGQMTFDEEEDCAVCGGHREECHELQQEYKLLYQRL